MPAVSFRNSCRRSEPMPTWQTVARVSRNLTSEHCSAGASEGISNARAARHTERVRIQKAGIILPRCYRRLGLLRQPFPEGVGLDEAGGLGVLHKGLPLPPHSEAGPQQAVRRYRFRVFLLPGVASGERHVALRQLRLEMDRLLGERDAPVVVLALQGRVGLQEIRHAVGPHAPLDHLDGLHRLVHLVLEEVIVEQHERRARIVTVALGDLGERALVGVGLSRQRGEAGTGAEDPAGIGDGLREAAASIPSRRRSRPARCSTPICFIWAMSLSSTCGTPNMRWIRSVSGSSINRATAPMLDARVLSPAQLKPVDDAIGAGAVLLQNELQVVEALGGEIHACQQDGLTVALRHFHELHVPVSTVESLEVGLQQVVRPSARETSRERGPARVVVIHRARYAQAEGVRVRPAIKNRLVALIESLRQLSADDVRSLSCGLRIRSSGERGCCRRQDADEAGESRGGKPGGRLGSMVPP